MSDKMGTAMLVEGKEKIDFGKKIIEFGAYAVVYVETHNNMKKKSAPAVVLKASNEEGGYFSCLSNQEKDYAVKFWKRYL